MDTLFACFGGKIRGMQAHPMHTAMVARSAAPGALRAIRRRWLLAVVGCALANAGLHVRAAPVVPSAGGLDDDKPPGVLPARVPPSLRLVFGMRSGLLRGQAELVYQRQDNVYRMDLRGRAIGLDILHLSSRGRIGAHGFEPERYADQRLSRAARVAEFDRASGHIRYAGSETTRTLSPGCQDRLTWMLQLSGVLDAVPALRQPGSELAFLVSGARTDLDVWRFVVHGLEPVTPDSGAALQALRLTRSPRRPRDTEVEIWLDPARGFLPVRARLTTMPDGDTLELSLRA
jgi:hypothetical protein